MKLEELERRLRNDITQEAIAWAGRVMLHKEVSLDTPASRQVDFAQAAAPSELSKLDFRHHCAADTCLQGWRLPMQSLW